MGRCDKIRTIIGIDGGGTKTDFMLCGTDLKPVRELTLEGCNPNDVGMEHCFEILRTGICELTINLRNEDISLFAGLSGGSTGNNRKTVLEFLQDLLPGAAVDCGSDIQNAVETGLGDSNGIVVICGTGSIAIAKSNCGIHKMGGYGYLFGEGCSGYAFGNAAILAALRADDKSGRETLMLEMINRRLGRSVFPGLGEIYNKGKRYIASFADIVFDAYGKGDTVAGDIINENIAYIADLIKSARKVYATEKTVKLLGGVFLHQHFLLNRLRDMELKNFDIQIITKPPVFGAVKIAGRNFKC